MAKILFLEDEKTIREIISEYLLVAQHEVIECDNGEDAIKLLSMHTFDLAILDILVLGPSGLAVLAAIRNSSQSKMGVIMLTAFDDLSTQLEAFNALADDYITKPASPILLLKRIEVLLRRITVGMQPQMENGLLIDQASYKAYYNQTDLHLTLSEFMIAKLLSDKPNQVFTREQLLQHLFQDENFVNTRVIDAHKPCLTSWLPTWRARSMN